MAKAQSQSKSTPATKAPEPEPFFEEAVPADEGLQSRREGYVFDLSQVPDEAELVVVPRGVYDAEVHDLTFGFSQASGNPMWTWVFVLQDSAGEYAGRKLYFHTPFTENMMTRVKKVLGRVAPELLDGPIDAEQIAEEGTLLGRTCRLRIDIRPYEGKKRNNVRDVLASADGGGGDFLQT